MNWGQVASNRPIVFVVDDENIIASTLGLILISKGFATRGFVHPMEALEAARFGKPDLLITDVVMPILNGIDLAIAMRQLHSECKVLLISGQPVTAELLARAASQGHHFAILAKPFHPDDIIARLHELLGTNPQ